VNVDADVIERRRASSSNCRQVLVAADVITSLINNQPTTIIPIYTVSQKYRWSKNSGERPHRRGGFSYDGINVIRLKHCTRLPQSRCRRY